VTVVTLTAIILFVVQRALRAQAKPAVTGAAGLLGEVGTASTDIDPQGKVFVHGEFWNASSQRAVRKGDKIRVIRVDGLHLLVEPHEQTRHLRTTSRKA
jgi:membrane-bound serine protease (ClpP class)